MLTLRHLALLPLLALAACGGEESRAKPSSSGAASPIAWTALGSTVIPEGLRMGREVEVVASDDGFVLLGSGYARIGGLQPYASPDGITWSPSDPPDLDRDSALADVAGSPSGSYLLGAAQGTSSPVVWRHRAGAWGEPVALTAPGAVFGPQVPTRRTRFVADATGWAVASGPAGVLVAALDPDDGTTVNLWTSRDGQDFTASTTSLPTPDSAVNESLVATSRGFVLAAGGGLLSITADGVASAVDLDLPDDVSALRVAVNGDRLVVQGTITTQAGPDSPDYASGDTSGANARFANGVWCSSGFTGDSGPVMRAADVDPGTLPDVGVVPQGGEYPASVSASGSGFVMTGEADGLGALWTSWDGCTWAKQPVRANGFDDVQTLVSSATSDDTSVVVGRESVQDGSLLLHLWRSGPGSAPASSSTTTGATTPGPTSPVPTARPSTSVPTSALDAYLALDSSAPDLDACAGSESTEPCYDVNPLNPADVVISRLDGGTVLAAVRMGRADSGWQVVDTYRPGVGVPPSWLTNEISGD